MQMKRRRFSNKHKDSTFRGVTFYSTKWWNYVPLTKPIIRKATAYRVYLKLLKIKIFDYCICKCIFTYYNNCVYIYL